ncbi:hypothetical protein [Magnetovibrio blakemorei]|uniref:Uncharacterized protein n=1 Tax=Magnetovibrio blakemorei TaxID=28181 RepID=A0A1E5Q5M0_9PROT|nr:hypothetical protein [Magnetovibrio blakemorei]OEJ65199.1 hypothetical protein BEN30_15110 [Magnetovibrio blakemorei]
MPNVLPQQRLLLELIVQSGDIAVPSDNDGTVLFRTLQECEGKGWLKLKPFGQGFNMASVTDQGRTASKHPSA